MKVKATFILLNDARGKLMIPTTFTKLKKTKAEIKESIDHIS
jgi:hypothetical protein